MRLLTKCLFLGLASALLSPFFSTTLKAQTLFVVRAEANSVYNAGAQVTGHSRELGIASMFFNVGYGETWWPKGALEKADGGAKVTSRYVGMGWGTSLMAQARFSDRIGNGARFKISDAFYREGIHIYGTGFIDYTFSGPFRGPATGLGMGITY